METATLDEMIRLRHDIHAHPELAYEEHRTADIVARVLGECGMAVHRGLGGTGVVGVLRRGDGPSIGLRADMDALSVTETGEAAHRSCHEGVMHACGHDGHVAMLLGAARELSRATAFRGTVHFIFQPAEECGGGGQRMVDEGLFDRFPCDQIFALHNWPGLAAGTVAVRTGAMMASLDTFDIRIRGLGAHAAMPERGRDPIVAGAELVGSLQAVVSREVRPNDPAVLTITQFHAGDAYNVIPQDAVLRGTVRCFSAAVRDQIEAAIGRKVAGIAAAHGVAIEIDYKRGYPSTINHVSGFDAARAAALATVGADRLETDFEPSLASEDFAFMLNACPGAYMWLGAGEQAPSLHNPRFDFNDALLPIGSRLWIELVHQRLPVS